MTSLVFPTFNPGSSIDRTWAAVREFLRTQLDPWEVLFICDGCTDGTPERLARLAASERRVRVIGYAPNRGKGYAVRCGLLAARGRWRVFTDVDLAYSFEDIVRVADELRQGASVAIASREHPESTLLVPPQCIGYAYRRRLQSRLFGAVARRVLPLAQRDTQAGLKGLTGEMAEQLVPRMRCDGFGFDCELLTACARLGVPVAEVPVCVRYGDAASTTGLGSTLGMVRDLWRIRRTWRAVESPVAVGEPIVAWAKAA